MAVPDFQTLMLPLLRLANDGQQHSVTETVDGLADAFQLSQDDRAELLRSGQTRFYNRVNWAITYLKKAGLLQRVALGKFQITDRGRELLTTKPSAINVAFLESRFPEMAAFRQPRAADEVADEPAFDAVEGDWKHREGVEFRIRSTLENSIPNEGTRNAALDLVAHVVEYADDESANSWLVAETEFGLRVMAGRLIACEIYQSQLRVSIIGEISDDVRSAIGTTRNEDEEFKVISGGRMIRFPADRASTAFAIIRDGIRGFIEAAIARVRSSVTLDAHVPEALKYIGGVVGRELPQPRPLSPKTGRSDVDDDIDDAESAAPREPRVRGRAPIFEHGQRSIASLMSDIEREMIALPDLQRPFVWEDTKVRDLLELVVRWISSRHSCILAYF